MKVCVVCYENPNRWILGKIARKLDEHLVKRGVDSTLVRMPSDTAEINYHVYYGNYVPAARKNDVLMITHIDSARKAYLLRIQLKTALHGICMSRETMDKLVEAGIPRRQLSFVNPAHDGVLRPRKFRLGILSKLHVDGRKNENFLVQIFESLSAEDFRVDIMGSGWESVVEQLRAMGVEVNYAPQFDYNAYIELVPSLDYFLYFGFDEGSMAFIDAAVAGVRTVVTPQGYHLDAPDGITHPVRTVEEIVEVFSSVAAERRKRIQSVQNWTWDRYAEQHQAIFQELLAGVAAHQASPVAGAAVVGGQGQSAGGRGYQVWKMLYVLLAWPSAKYYNCVEYIKKWRFFGGRI